MSKQLDVTVKNVRALMRKWKPRLGLGKPWSISVAIHPDGSSMPGGEAQRDVAGMCIAEPGYHIAQIHLNKYAIDNSAQGLEPVLLHECVHILTWSLRTIAINALGEDHSDTARMLDEQTVEAFTRALLYK